MNHQTKNFETQIAFFLQKTNNQIEKKFKKSYEHLFQPNIFSKLLKINHEYIIKLYEINEINKTLTYEYFESISLREKLQLDNNIDFITLKKILQNIAVSIDYLHQSNIAHIDINDTNILINKSFDVKLNDFDFIEIMTNKDDNLKRIDIHSYIILVYRIIQLPKQWNAIKTLNFSYNIPNQEYSNCLDFFNKLELKIEG
jgi:serine/threonine protein kinase